VYGRPNVDPQRLVKVPWALQRGEQPAHLFVGSLSVCGQFMFHFGTKAEGEFQKCPVCLGILREAWKAVGGSVVMLPPSAFIEEERAMVITYVVGEFGDDSFEVQVFVGNADPDLGVDTPRGSLTLAGAELRAFHDAHGPTHEGVPPVYWVKDDSMKGPWPWED